MNCIKYGFAHIRKSTVCFFFSLKYKIKKYWSVLEHAKESDWIMKNIEDHINRANARVQTKGSFANLWPGLVPLKIKLLLFFFFFVFSALFACRKLQNSRIAMAVLCCKSNWNKMWKIMLQTTRLSTAYLVYCFTESVCASLLSITGLNNIFVTSDTEDSSGSEAGLDHFFLFFFLAV